MRKDLEEEQEGRFYKVCPELGTYKGWHDGVRKGGDTERPLRGDTFSMETMRGVSVFVSSILSIGINKLALGSLSARFRLFANANDWLAESS